MAILAAIPCAVAVLHLGRVHPDETFQYLEPALYRVRHYGILAWEWHAGLRNWAMPLVLSWMLRLSDSLGVSDPRIARAFLAVPQFLLQLWSLAAVLAYARRRLEERGAWLALGLVALNGQVLALGGRTLGEPISAALLLIALEALDRRERPVRAGLFGGAALGLAVVARYGSAIFVVAALGWLVARRRWRMLAATCAMGAVVAAGLGLLDWVTWGSLFHSLRAYTAFNVFSPQAAERFGREPAAFYLPWIALLTPLWVWWGLAHRVRAERPRVALGLVAGGVYLAAITATAHKEVRFLYPALLLWTAEGSVGFAGALRALALSARWRSAVAGLALLLGGLTYAFQHAVHGDQFHTIVAATRGSDAHGLLVLNLAVWGSGGYFLVGKPIPLVFCESLEGSCVAAALADPAINRASTSDDLGLQQLEAAGFRLRERMGHAAWLAR